MLELLLEVISSCVLFVCKHLLFDIFAPWCFYSAPERASHSVLLCLEGMLWSAYVNLLLAHR
jgi:hypothetical protein